MSVEYQVKVVLKRLQLPKDVVNGFTLGSSIGNLFGNSFKNIYS